MAQEGFRKSLFGDDGPMVELPCADDETLSMWVADMAFAAPPVATKAMAERIERPVFGYTGVLDDHLFDALGTWCEHHYGWAPQSEHIVTSRGVVQAIRDLIEQIVEPGQKVLTLTPAYGQFEKACNRHGRELVMSDLEDLFPGPGDTGYAIDFDDFAAKVADPQMRMFLLCHPHNPSGRVWTNDELTRMAELCFANDVVVVSDEIHCDLQRVGVSHTPLSKLLPDSDQIITCMSASKTFNLAGLGLAHVIIPNDQYRQRWDDCVSSLVNPVSLAATTAVFRDGQAWLDQLRTYLDANFALLHRRLADELPEARFEIPQATYLAWVNLSNYFGAESSISRHVAETTGLLLEGANMFSANADGYVRLNLACPRSVVDDAVGRLALAVEQ